MVSTLILAGMLVGFGTAQLAPFKSGEKAPAQRAAAPAGTALKNAPKENPFTSIQLQEVTDKDHIRGGASAKITIVEFSDTECPFCKRFHPTMQKIIAAYPNDVNWVYRHFPLDSLHPKARKEAEATECAAELGGNEKFWAYLDRLFEVTPSNNGLDPAELPKIAEYVGLNKGEFTKCLESGRHAQLVAGQLQDAMTAGGEGTPYSILITPNGEKFPVSGALPFEKMKPVIDKLLSGK